MRRAAATRGRLAGKVAVVTGGASGIGQAIAESFAAESADVIIVDLNVTAGRRVAAAIRKSGGSATFSATDVATIEPVEKLFKAIVKRHGHLDVVVNSAGVSSVGNIEACSSAELDRVYTVNVKGTFHTMKAAVPHLRGRGGVIINLASVVSHLGIPDRLAYSMSKGAVLTMTYAMATDYVRQGIRVNAIAPARVHTPFVDGFLARNYPGHEREMFEKLASTQPIGRMAEPVEVAETAVFLASDAAAFITGTCVNVDGGFVHCKTN
jgi:2-keto-3-deoxy-L-fuconate dehydrogenase